MLKLKKTCRCCKIVKAWSEFSNRAKQQLCFDCLEKKELLTLCKKKELIKKLKLTKEEIEFIKKEWT